MPRRYYRKPPQKNTHPRQIIARFDGICAETGTPIKKGTPCIYYPLNKQIFCLESEQAKEFRDMKADEAMGHTY